MGCGCNKGRDPTISPTSLRQSYATPDSAGLFPLASAPDCTEPYHGAFARSNVTLYVVGMGTEHERLFLRGQRNEATKMARGADGQRLTLDQVHPANLCHEVVAEFLGA